jgi:hypothetical protein
MYYSLLVGRRIIVGVLENRRGEQRLTTKSLDELIAVVMT